MTTKHTPEPWSCINEDTQGAQIHAADGTAVALALWVGRKDERPTARIDEVRANADLLAAAPDLLKALRLCITEAGALSMIDPAQHARKRLDHISATARAAIAKAEGATK
jgi:hypothetical protein